MAPTPTKPKGLSTRREPRYRIADHLALANEHRDWVIIEAKAKPILDHIRNLGPFDGEQQIGKGLVIYWEDTSSVRL